jgi:SAM-dependent methyltransferase
MLTDYRMLIAGAGTGGFIRLLRNYREIVCLDIKPHMIAQAIHTPRVSFVCGDFRDYDGTGFDAVSIVGLVGWYMPWTGNEWALTKVRAMLNPGGLLIASHTPPRNLLHRGKELAFPRRTVVLNRARFLRMMERHGFSELVHQQCLIGKSRESAVSISRAK